MTRSEGLDSARAFIDAHFTEPLTLVQMAAPAALSVSRFVTVFRLRFGSSPYRYLCGLRIARAQALLSAGLPSVVVAAEVGFFDQSHFGRHFKRWCGMTPTTFAAQARAFRTASSTGTSTYDHRDCNYSGSLQKTEKIVRRAGCSSCSGPNLPAPILALVRQR